MGTEHEIKHPIHSELQMRPRSWATAMWTDYVAAGGSTVNESRTWRTSREDLAWLFHKFLQPHGSKLDELDARVADLEGTTGSGLEARVAILESQISAINDATDVATD